MWLGERVILAQPFQLYGNSRNERAKETESAKGRSVMKQITEELLARCGAKSIHPVAKLFPLMEENQYKGLLQSIKETGQQETIKLLADGTLVDGRNRLLALAELGLVCTSQIVEPKDVTSWIVNANLHRRHLTSGQRAMIAEELCTLQHGTNQFSNRGLPRVELLPETLQTAAKKMDVARASVSMARDVRKHAPELVDEVKSGSKSLKSAARVAETKRRASKPARKDKESGPTYSERVRQLPGAGQPMKFLTPEEFDPDFKGTSMEFASKNGFVLLETKAEREKAKALSQTSFWIGELRKLKTPLTKFLEHCPITQSQVNQWIEKFGSEKAEKRGAEIKELINLLQQAASSIKSDYN